MHSYKDEPYFSMYRENGANTMQSLAPVALVPMSGSREMTEKINEALVQRRIQYLEENQLGKPQEYGLIRNDYTVSAETVRFSSGEAKALFKQTVRGHDLFIICDVTNHSVTYKYFGQEVPMGPDDYYQDLKRLILATCGRARRVNVVMPFLYEARQDIRNSRESLDCANMLNELFDLGVASVITFDPHESRVENAVPTKGLDAIPATYHLISAFFSACPHVELSGEHGLMVVSPDESGMKRGMYYASVLEVPLSTFFRQRDYSRLVDGRNPIVDYHYLGESVAGRDILLVDDMMVTGETFLETARKLKALKARNIYAISTFGMFSHGLEEMNKAYEEGIFQKVIITNLSYISDKLKKAPWVAIADMTPHLAKVIDALNHNVSLANLLDHTESIKELLKAKQQKDHFNSLFEERT